MRRPQSGWRNSLAGDRSIFWIDSSGLLGQELLEVVAAELEFFFVGCRDLSEISILEVQAEAVVGPVCQRLPGPFRLLGVGGQILLDGLADGLAGAVARPWTAAISSASSKLAPLMSRAVSSIPEALADPFGEAGCAVVVGEKPAARRPRSGCRSCRGSFPWAEPPRAGSGGTSRRASAARP